MITYNFSIKDFSDITSRSRTLNKYTDLDKEVMIAIERCLNFLIKKERPHNPWALVNILNIFTDINERFEVSPISFYLRNIPSVDISITSTLDEDIDIYEDEWHQKYTVDEVDEASTSVHLIHPYERTIVIEGVEDNDRGKNDLISILNDNVLRG